MASSRVPLYNKEVVRVLDHALVAELVYAQVLGTCGETLRGSSPLESTKIPLTDRWKTKLCLQLRKDHLPFLYEI